MLENLLENPSPFFQWLWTEPSWINMSNGDLLVLGTLIGSALILGVVNRIRTGESGFF